MSAEDRAGAAGDRIVETEVAEVVRSIRAAWVSIVAARAALDAATAKLRDAELRARGVL